MRAEIWSLEDAIRSGQKYGRDYGAHKYCFRMLTDEVYVEFPFDSAKDLPNALAVTARRLADHMGIPIDITSPEIARDIGRQKLEELEP